MDKEEMIQRATTVLRRFSCEDMELIFIIIMGYARKIGIPISNTGE